MTRPGGPYRISTGPTGPAGERFTSPVTGIAFGARYGRYWARTSDPQLVEEDQGADETS